MDLSIGSGYGWGMKYRLLIPLACLLASPALADDPLQPPAYKECTALAASNPQQALAKADAWLKVDDGFSAHHCRAMALYGLQQFDKAAAELMIVRDKVVPDNIALRTYIARQGAKAWVNAGRVDQAFALLEKQIHEMSVGKFDNATEAQLSSGLLLDHAKLRVQYGQAAQAVQDLDHAISLTPLDTDVLLERALAFEQLGDKSLAKQDAQSVLRLDPKNGPSADLMRRLRDK